jgi:hypothetical protein
MVGIVGSYFDTASRASCPDQDGIAGVWKRAEPFQKDQLWGND